MYVGVYSGMKTWYWGWLMWMKSQNWWHGQDFCTCTITRNNWNLLLYQYNHRSTPNNRRCVVTNLKPMTLTDDRPLQPRSLTVKEQCIYMGAMCHLSLKCEEWGTLGMVALDLRWSSVRLGCSHRGCQSRRCHHLLPWFLYGECGTTSERLFEATPHWWK